MRPLKQAFDASCRERLTQELDKLKALQNKHLHQLELQFSKGLEQVNEARRKQQQADTADLFRHYQEWVRNTLELDDRAQFTVIAALMA